LTTHTLQITSGELEATFAPQAGMVGCSLRHRGEELLVIGGGLAEYVSKGEFFGIPFLYPWANRLGGFDYEVLGRRVTLQRDSPLILLDENGLPIHGLLTASPLWKVVDETERSLRATLDFGAHDEPLDAFPFPHTLKMDVRVEGATLILHTTVSADRDAAVPISFGYHPYFRIPGAAREEWKIELPVRERLVLDERMIPTGEREPVGDLDGPLGERSFDDGYAALEPGRPFVVAGAGRRIAVSFDEGFPFAQVYSPPGAEFICFEPMTTPTNALRDGTDLPIVEPGESFSATWRVAVI
jgi:galactose mutarotase-like enzyme